MLEIIPAVMPLSYRDIEQKIEKIIESVRTIQLDLMDGKYVSAKTWPFNDFSGSNWQNILNEEHGMPSWESVDYELDLMIEDVPKYFTDLVRIGPTRIIFHFPKNKDKKEELKKFILNLDNFYKYEIQLGIAYEHGDDLQDILDIGQEIKFVQCMGIDQIGIQGAHFDETVFERIEKIKETLPDVEITIDGSVNTHTIKRLHDAGAIRFVVGSAIFNNEYPSIAVNELYDLISN